MLGISYKSEFDTFIRRGGAQYIDQVDNVSAMDFFDDVSLGNITNGTIDVSAENITDGMSLFGWTSSFTFSASDYNTVAWTGGDIKLADGTTFSIDAGNTGNMTALTYIYLDKSVSETVLQITTTAADSVGLNKILVGVAKNNTDTASKAQFQVFGGSGGVLLTVDNIAANSASTNQLISNTAQIKDAIITSAKIVSLDADVINTGTLTGINVISSSGTNRIQLTNGNLLEFYYGGSRQAYQKSDSSGNLSIYAEDNIKLKPSNSTSAEVVDGGIMPASDFGQDLGREGSDNKRWRYVYARTFYGGSSGTAGEDKEDIGFITSIRADDGRLEAKYREVTVRGGIVTDIGGESGWADMGGY